MIASRNRFHGINSLNYVYRHGQTIRGKYMAIKYAPNKRRDTYRLAVVVSRKVTKSSPTRNRIRRRIYEIIRTDSAGRLGNLDIVITVFDEKIATMPHDLLRSVILQAVDAMTGGGE